MQQVIVHRILMIFVFVTALQFMCKSCVDGQKQETAIEFKDREDPIIIKPVVERPATIHTDTIDTKNTEPFELVIFAKTLIGTPYKYGSSDPAIGFDCSGFITYVFNHFNINVPRSSVDFTDVGNDIFVADAKEGDLILFTGTDSTIRVVGHMGIVTENSDTLKFIHSTSGKLYGVTITPLNSYYQGRFVKVIRIFNSL